MMKQFHSGYSESEALFILRNAVENTNEAFVTIDEDQKVIFFNKAAEKIFGFQRQDVVGRDLSVIMTSECSRDHRHAVEMYVKKKVPGNIKHNAELIATRKNGEKIPINISFSSCQVDGKFHFTAIIRDLTEKKALESRILKAERLAALGQVVAEITHEIKNPLMMIGGFAKQLRRQHSDEKTAAKLIIIEEETARLEKLLNELKQYYQPGLLKTERYDLNVLLEEVLKLMRNDCNQKNIIVTFEKHLSPLFIMGDGDKLKQVFLNLLKNAIESIDDQGKITVQSSLDGDHVTIRIVDDGCGISKEKRERIFSPFYTTKQHGTGLGLSISKSIIENHEGSSFTMESREGKGTTFKITLPVSR